eukprot:6210606-Amphidinium_carterae.1
MDGESADGGQYAASLAHVAQPVRLFSDGEDSHRRWLHIKCALVRYRIAKPPPATDPRTPKFQKSAGVFANIGVHLRMVKPHKGSRQNTKVFERETLKYHRRLSNTGKK